MDQRARSQSQAAYQKLHKAMGEDKNLQKVTQEQVHEMLGRSPDKDDDDTDLYEEYRWRGGIYTQTLYVSYYAGTVPQLKDVSLNEKPGRPKRVQ